MRFLQEIPPFRAPRPIIRLINSDTQLVWLIAAFWALSLLAMFWIYAG